MSFTESIAGLVELEIARGAPVFHDGKPNADAAINKVTITAITDLASHVLESDAGESLHLTLAEGQAQQAAIKCATGGPSARGMATQDAV